MPRDAVRFEYQGALAETVGAAHGLTKADWRRLGHETVAIVRHLNRTRARTPYRDVPSRPDLSQVKQVLASAARRRGKFDDVVVLGIGGSALGKTAHKTALRPPYWNFQPEDKRPGLPRLWVMDNVDPDEFAAMIGLIDPRRTLFNVISKSGETAETMSQFLVALDVLKGCLGKAWRKNVVVTTDAAKGILRPMVQQERLDSFVVPDGVGGRFSVLTPVGLFPAALIW